MKMEPIVSSETSAIRTQTPGNYPKRNNLHLEHGESLRTWDEKCLQRGTDWVFKWSGLYFVFKGLMAKFKVPDLQSNADWRDAEKWQDSDMISAEIGRGAVCPSAPHEDAPPDIR